MNLNELSASVQNFYTEAQAILGFSEQSVHRTAELSSSYAKIDDLTAQQADMLRQSLRCVELGLFRAAHVLCWAAVTDLLQNFAEKDNFSSINLKYPSWKIKNLDDLRDAIGEYNLIEGMFHSKMITKSEKKALHSLLNKRNECAHPSDYYPDLNQSLGYVSECISRIDYLSKKYG